MRCKKHLTDLSSSVGVCASCLRERLFSLIAAQEQANHRHHHSEQANHHSEQANHHHHPTFPRSVSPYVSRNSTTTTCPKSNDHPLFFNTPQLAPNKKHHHHRHRHVTLSLLSKLFRGSRPNPNADPDPRRSSSSAPSWLSFVFHGVRRKKQSRLFSMDESTQRRCRKDDRGMSPAMYSEDEECIDVTTSGYTSEQQTPARRRHQRNATTTNLTFCLSPLVRASPNRHWKTTADVGLSGEIRGVVKPPNLSYAKTFCANRSRKLADIGRFNPNHHLN